MPPEPWRQPKLTHTRLWDVEGETFGNRFVLGYAGKRCGNSYWWCRCTSCGRERGAYKFALQRVGSTLCPCRKDTARPAIADGLSLRKEYRCWASMHWQCTRPSDDSWAAYGGRRIRTCTHWLDRARGFLNFLEDMGPRPEGTTLERKNSDGPNEPANCRWATTAEQARNRRSNRMLPYQGRTQAMVDWASEYGLPVKTLPYRLNAGWTTEDALTTPLRIYIDEQITHEGRSMSIAGWAREKGLNPSALRGRVRSGWPVPLALSAPTC